MMTMKLRRTTAVITLLLVYMGALTLQSVNSITREKCTIERDLNIGDDLSTRDSKTSMLFDGNLRTGWIPSGNSGNSAEVNFDLGRAKRICFIDIGWGVVHKPNQFQISASSDSNTQFTQPYIVNSFMNNSEFERYDFQDVFARYLNLKLFRSNNSYPEVTEVKIYVYKAISRDSKLPRLSHLPLYDDFEKDIYSKSKWNVEYTGHGHAGIKSEKGYGSFYRMFPASSTSSTETHAALVTTSDKFADFRLTADVRTDTQLRQNSEPNKWEVAWIFFRYTDTFHYYWFSLKPNGFELGKKDCNSCKDPTDGQIILYTGPLPTVKIREWSQWTIEMIEDHIKISIDGNKIIDLRDSAMSSRLSNGRIGMYTEDAKVSFDNFHILQYD